MPAPDGRLPIARLPKRADFLRVAAAQTRCATRGLALQLAASPDATSGMIRVGFTATKKIGNAVIRNRARRRLRAVAREVMPMHALPARDYVLLARQDTAVRPYGLLLGDLEAALKRLGAWRETETAR